MDSPGAYRPWGIFFALSSLQCFMKVYLVTMNATPTTNATQVEAEDAGLTTVTGTSNDVPTVAERDDNQGDRERGTVHPPASVHKPSG
jgi:hypothetical protein